MAAPAFANTQEELREVQDEFDEEVGEIYEEDAEDHVDVLNLGEIELWIALNSAVVDRLVDGQDPLDDPELVDAIQAAAPAENPLYLVDIHNRVEQYAHAKGATRVAEVLRYTGPVFQEIAEPGSTEPLECTALGLVGMLLTLSFARIGRRV